MKKLYFSGEDNCCYDIGYWRQLINDEDTQEIELTEAIPYKLGGFFWCKEIMEIGEVGDLACGSHCPNYDPRNGKSGCCKHYSKIFYEPGNKKIILKNKNHERPIEKPNIFLTFEMPNTCS